ncbi:recombinase family protein [Luteococcus sp. H138]|uniref:recombinase family protein n=1 Tax=unclassified Luteococcus TaxID=2639923 RepID=UPI00313D6C85
MTVWGYARVSTQDQDTAPQFEALRRAGVAAENIVTDHASGARTDRPGLASLLAQVQPGDVLTVWKLDRLGRSLSHLVQTVEDLGQRGVEFRSLTEALDTTSPAGRLLFHVIGAVAQFERDLTSERTRAALEVARSSGRPMGRPSKVTREQFALVHRMARAGASQSVIAATTGLSRPVVGRVVRGEIASLAKFEGAAQEGELPLYESED